MHLKKSSRSVWVASFTTFIKTNHMNNLNESIQPINQDRRMKLNFTGKFSIGNNKSGPAEFGFNQVAMNAATKGNLDLMTYLMPYYAINQIRSEVSKITKLLQPNPKPNHSKDAYDLPEAANYLGIGKSTLRKALSEKEIIGDRVGRKWRFTKVQLDRYIKRGKSDAEIDSEVENAILNNKRKRK